MEETLSKLAEIIGLNGDRGYLYVETANDSFKLWVVERGTGGCTFPTMELLAEHAKDQNFDFEAAILLKDLLLEITQAKETIKHDNPHFYHDVFK